MGYYARYTGAVTIIPALNWPEIKSMREHFGDLDDLDIKIVVTEQETETADGMLIKRHADRITPWSEDSMKGYRMEEQLQAVADLFPDRVYGGHIEAVGEDGARWRLRIRDGVAETIHPELRWPE